MSSITDINKYIQNLDNYMLAVENQYQKDYQNLIDDEKLFSKVQNKVVLPSLNSLKETYEKIKSHRVEMSPQLAGRVEHLCAGVEKAFYDHKVLSHSYRVLHTTDEELELIELSRKISQKFIAGLVIKKIKQNREWKGFQNEVRSILDKSDLKNYLISQHKKLQSNKLYLFNKNRSKHRFTVIEPSDKKLPLLFLLLICQVSAVAAQRVKATGSGFKKLLEIIRNNPIK